MFALDMIFKGQEDKFDPFSLSSGSGDEHEGSDDAPDAISALRYHRRSAHGKCWSGLKDQHEKKRGGVVKHKVEGRVDIKNPKYANVAVVDNGLELSGRVVSSRTVGKDTEHTILFQTAKGVAMYITWNDAELRRGRKLFNDRDNLVAMGMLVTG